MGKRLVPRGRGELKGRETFAPGGELWRYAPASDAQGRPLSDLMMLLPGKSLDESRRLLIRHQLQEVLAGFGDKVFFAELNHRLGILWVTVASEPGLCGDVVDAIRARISGAKVIGNYVKGPPADRLPWTTRVRRLIS